MLHRPSKRCLASGIQVAPDSGVGRYEILEDVALADCALEIEGRDLDDLFETAAGAVAELMVDPATVELSVERRIVLTADTVDLLLYDWLSELLFRKDRDREVFPRAEVRVGGDGPFTLEADVRGGVIDRARMALRADPKAVTFHQFTVTPVDRGDGREGGWRARLVIDI
jgi:SHS2 domain-containing protein